MSAETQNDRHKTSEKKKVTSTYYNPHALQSRIRPCGQRRQLGVVVVPQLLQNFGSGSMDCISCLLIEGRLLGASSSPWAGRGVPGECDCDAIVPGAISSATVGLGAEGGMSMPPKPG